MTWGEFKDKIEAQGVQEDTRIFYIDVHCPYKPEVTFGHDLGIVVSE